MANFGTLKNKNLQFTKDIFRATFYLFSSFIFVYGYLGKVEKISGRFKKVA